MPNAASRYANFFDLTDQTVLVTGAAGQIGRTFVTALLDFGARVVATDQSETALKSTAARMQWSSEAVHLGALDIRSRQEVEDTLARSVDRFGTLNALVNNAGVSVFEPWEQRSDESFSWVTDVNLNGTFNCTQAFLKYRIDQGGGGAVVSVASHYGLISPDPRIYAEGDRKNSEAYGATKAGVIQMMRYFAVHAAEHKIRCNSISPGGIRNPDEPQAEEFRSNYAFRCPMKRMGELDEMAGGLVFLLAPAAGYVNGHNLVIDGGMTAW